ncbi:unnamed protein product [Pieris macdunnoughi]|uniref:Protein lethal(2)denticleless n=1 Tax=Pieris macdunnoughi TaxID=345717 RepID=A0A821Y1G1_9NEOP|nr:unnamed protein product [Pieris macdunnoughi]
MNNLQSVIDRQLGIYGRFNYDNILKRFVVYEDESYYGLQSNAQAANFDQDSPIFACRFSEASGYEHIVALADEDGQVTIQDTSTASKANSLEGFQCHDNAVFDLAWMPKHMNFVTVSGDHTASLWNVAESAPRRVVLFTHHTRSVKTAVFRPQEPAVFATGARDGRILIWDVRANNQPSVVVKPDNCLVNCHSLSFTPKTPGSHSKRARLDPHRAISVTGLVFQDDQTLISCGECDGIIKVWDLRKNYSVHRREPLPKHAIPYCGMSTKNGYTNLIIDNARMRLYASCMDNYIYCFNISTYNTIPEQRYRGHENSTFYIKTSLSPDSMYLVSGSSDKNAYIWNVKYSDPIVKLTGHWAEVTCAAWCQKGDVKIVTCSDDARHKIWRIGRECLEDDVKYEGKAEIVPRRDISHPDLWKARHIDLTPNSLKRRLGSNRSSSQSPKRMRTESATGRKTKRCLTDLMNASKGDESLAKRLRPDVIPEEEEPKLLPAGSKRHLNDDRDSGKKVYNSDPIQTASECYIAQASCSFTTPTKNYEKKSCKLLSPKSPKAISPSTMSNRTPVKVTPSKVRIISFSTPTENLPNYVLTGEAPHLSLMSPVKKKQDTTNWLTLMVRQKKGKVEDKVQVTSAPLSPKDQNTPTRRNSATERLPKTNKHGTLLKYFSVSRREN